MEIIVIFTIHNQYIYIYTHSLSIIKIIMTSIIHIPILPKMSQRRSKSPHGPPRSPGWNDVRLLGGIQKLHPGPCEAAQREHLQGDGKPPRVASHATTDGGRFFKRKKHCRRLTKFSKGMMCEGKIMENPR